MCCMGITELREEFWQGSAGSTFWAFGSVGSISWGLGSVGSISWGLGSVGSRSRGWGASDSVVRSIGICGSVKVKIFPGSFLVFFFLLLWAFSLSPFCFLFRPLFLAGSFLGDSFKLLPLALVSFAGHLQCGALAQSFQFLLLSLSTKRQT